MRYYLGYFKPVSIIAVLTLIVVFEGNSCSNALKSGGFDSSATSSSDLSSSIAPGVGSGPSVNNDIKVIPQARTASVVYSKQVLNQLTACVGVNHPSDSTVAMYQTKRGAISTYGYANTVTSPMMMAVISIAAEVCNDLVQQESGTTQKIFVGADFTSKNPPDATTIQNWAGRIGLSCWQRSPTADENTAIVNLISSNVSAGEANAMSKSALMVCTAMLSSLDSLLN